MESRLQISHQHNTKSVSAECVLIKHDLIVHETRDANLFKKSSRNQHPVFVLFHLFFFVFFFILFHWFFFFFLILHDTLLCLHLHVEPTQSSNLRLFPLFITCQIQRCLFLRVILIYIKRIRSEDVNFRYS